MTVGFVNKVALVTGAKQGIGRAVADKLLALGTQVIEWDINWPQLTENRQEVDIADEKRVASSVCPIVNRFGKIDYLVNAAGVLHTGSLLEMPFEQWQHTFNVNTFGAMHVCRYVARAMRMSGGGSIVAVCSNAAKTPRIDMGAYAASKAATTQFIKCLGLELAEFGIRCNVVAPGSTDTPMQRALWQDENGESNTIKGNQQTFRTGIPLRRIAQPEDIANTIVYLLSDSARHITLETITVDGGATFGG